LFSLTSSKALDLQSNTTRLDLNLVLPGQVLQHLPGEPDQVVGPISLKNPIAWMKHLDSSE
jgi:hypothetical protein